MIVKQYIEYGQGLCESHMAQCPLSTQELKLCALTLDVTGFDIDIW